MARASAIVRRRMIRFSNIQNLIIDMDGVLWRGEQPLPRLPEFFDTLRELGVQFVLATNNASRTGNQYVQRLLRFGAAVNEDEVLTSPQATAAWRFAPARPLSAPIRTSPFRANGGSCPETGRPSPRWKCRPASSRSSSASPNPK